MAKQKRIGSLRGFREPQGVFVMPGIGRLAVTNGQAQRLTILDTSRLARVAEVPEGSAFYFHYPTPEDQAVLLHLPGGRFVAYSQKCTHLSCSVYFQPERDRLLCPCHEGVFDPRTGDPVAGPPVRRLPRIELRREGDQLIAVEEVP